MLNLSIHGSNSKDYLVYFPLKPFVFELILY